MFRVTRHGKVSDPTDWSNAGAPLGTTNCQYAIYGVELSSAEAAKMVWNRAKRVWE